MAWSDAARAAAAEARRRTTIKGRYFKPGTSIKARQKLVDAEGARVKTFLAKKNKEWDAYRKNPRNVVKAGRLSVKR
jgi:hypothetical protein